MNIFSKVKLNNNKEMPLLGLGTYLSSPGEETITAVEYALSIGYRHIDTASIYKNENDVGIAVKNSKIPREEIFVTTKVWNTDQGYESTLRAFDTSIQKLGLDYLDLYLVHWPVEIRRRDTWKAMIKLYDEGRVKAIGVSNYTIRHIKEVCSHSDVVPTVNQVEFSPYLNQTDLLNECNDRNIVVQAYSPLVRGRKFNDNKLLDIAAKYSKSPAQILIKWCLQMGMCVLPKSANPIRIKENADIFDFEISKDDMKLMKNFDENYRVAWDPSDIP